MGRAVSIQDIARSAGVSHTTVSRALHDNPLISLEVRENIQRLAKEMGYTPNAVAQSLKGQRTNTIGLVVTTIADPFVGRVVRGIEEIAQDANMNVFLGVSFNDPEKEMAVIESFHRRRVDGIIVAAAKISAQYSKRLAHINVPTVLINQQAESQYDMFHSVAVDDYSGARLAVEHLLNIGHRAIGYVGAGNRPRSNRMRLKAYQDAMAAAGIEINERWVKIAPTEHVYHTEDVADGQNLTMDLLNTGVTAIFCYNDMLAVGAMLACRERGIPVPFGLSLIGFDDIELAQYITPPLTTIHQAKLTLGKLAMQMLLDLLNGKPVENQILTPRLVLRDSTARAIG
jgi:LacI family transcriptional regulator/LacI family repressor for deo operon, udp, cdd, tsx, nupC, and nupG